MLFNCGEIHVFILLVVFQVFIYLAQTGHNVAKVSDFRFVAAVKMTTALLPINRR